jgi:hypothetical protein
MKKVIIAMSAIVCLGVSAAYAGPKSLKTGESGTAADGREYGVKIVTCHGSAGEQEIVQFAGDKKWCLKDESYCNKNMMKVAKKACK